MSPPHNAPGARANFLKPVKRTGTLTLGAVQESDYPREAALFHQIIKGEVTSHPRGHGQRGQWPFMVSDAFSTVSFTFSATRAAVSFTFPTI